MQDDSTPPEPLGLISLFCYLNEYSYVWSVINHISTYQYWEAQKIWNLMYILHAFNPTTRLNWRSNLISLKMFLCRGALMKEEQNLKKCIAFTQLSSSIWCWGVYVLLSISVRGRTAIFTRNGWGTSSRLADPFVWFFSVTKVFLE